MALTGIAGKLSGRPDHFRKLPNGTNEEKKEKMMKRRQFLQSAAGSAAVLGVSGKPPANSRAASAKAGFTDPFSLILWYLRPAKQWVQALPVGNGRLGAMVFGDTEKERIQLNEETVWSGGPYDPSNSKGFAALPLIRQQVLEGEYLKAHQIFGRTMFGLAIPQMQYQPLGDLRLTFPGHSTVSEYHRQLDLDQGIVTVKYRVGKVAFMREVFSSPVDQVIVIRLTADQPRQLNFTAALPSGNYEQRDGDAYYDVLGPNELVTRGRVMSDQGIEGQLRFEVRARVLAESGVTAPMEESLSVTGANAVTILIAAATSFVNYHDTSGDPGERVTQYFERAGSKSYEDLCSRHLSEHQRLFRRVHLDLGSSEAAKLPTDERLKGFKQTNDPGLVALYFQFGRYLLLSSSRPGGKPANLQGIWNDKTIPPWGSKWTTNINLEMNYWPVEVTNLSECAEPLFQFISDLVEPGSHVAQVNYGARGWVLHQNTDLWFATAPMDGPTWGTYATAGAWLCTHLWEHYLFQEDGGDLKRFYPLMKGAAQFFVDTLVEHPKFKWMVTCPSTSPEHTPKRPGQRPFWDEVTNLYLDGTTICAGPTMDMEILRSLFQATIEASELLDVDADFRDKLRNLAPRLAPLQIGKYGQLQEWLEDWDDPNDRHRHLSHLWGLYPGHEITPRRTPKLAAAAAKSIEFRGTGGMGWTMAWKVCLWARLLEGERAYQQLKNLLTAEDEDRISYKDGGTYLNLMNALPFQIDGNMGATAGIAEMLLQSDPDEIHLLPALPKAWANGSAKGFKARGGFLLDLEWQGGRLRSASVHSDRGKRCAIRTQAEISSVSLAGRPVQFTRPEPNMISFETTAGETYAISTRTRSTLG